MAKKNKRSKKSRPGGNRSFSTLSQHVLEGKTLRPPFRKLDKVTLTSWQDDHLPSMIWASLLTETLPRRDYLDCFRKLISHCGPWFADGGLLDRRALAPAKGDQINFSQILDFDSLAQLPDEHFRQFFDILVAHLLWRDALRPLLRLTQPPGIQRWHTLIDGNPADGDWEPTKLMRRIKTLRSDMQFNRNANA